MPPPRKRLLQLLASGAVALASVGLVLGTQSPKVPPVLQTARDGVGENALNYAQLRKGRRGPNREMYRGAFARLGAAGPSIHDPVVQTSAQKQEALVARSKRRAFAGAPPTIPHSVQEKDPAACMACHSGGAKIAQLRAPAMSHREFAMCTQCHAMEKSENAEVGALGALPENSFVGLGEYPSGQRAYEGAPPTIPHGVFMRENCASCHGVHGEKGVRSTHPGRQSCQQCHAASAEFDQRGPPPMGAPMN